MRAFTGRLRALSEGSGASEAAPGGLVATSFALLAGAGSLLGWAWWVLVGGGPHPGAIAALIALTSAGALAALALRRRLGLRELLVLEVLNVVVLSLAIGLTGGLESPFALFYAWVAAWTIGFQPRRVAAGVVALIVLGYAVGVVLDGGGFAALTPQEAGALLIRVGTVVALSALIASLGRGVARRERALERREARQRALARLGIFALNEPDVPTLLDEVMGAIAEQLGVPFVVLLRQDPQEDRLALAASYGWDRERLAPGALLPADPDALAAYLLAAESPIQSYDLAREDRFPWPASLRRAGVVSAAMVPVRSPRRTLGVLGAQDVTPRRFAAEEVNFLMSVANLVAGALERSDDEAALRHRGLHDALTELPNRVLFGDRLGQALERARRRGSILAVLFLDLDEFKEVNDTLGHRAGDELLRSLAPRLSGAVRATDTVARLGGDEFAVLCEDLTSEGEADELADRLLAAISRPVEALGAEMRVTGSIGIALSHAGDTDPDALVRDADTALYRAKEQGRARSARFEEKLRSRAEARVRTEAELRRALRSGELFLVFEPVVHLRTGVVVGAEALVRWRHPERGLLWPGEFISVAEASGLIEPLGRLVLRRACRAAAAWPWGWVSVNLSARQLERGNLVEIVSSALAESGLEHGRLRLELTESASFGESDTELARVRRLGVGVVFDDFGTGFSSLAHLRGGAVDALKVDRSFVLGLGGAGGGPEAPIVQAVVRLGEALGLEVIAEGVEDERRLAEVRALGCELAQGYAFGRELDADRMAELLAAGVDETGLARVASG